MQSKTVRLKFNRLACFVSIAAGALMLTGHAQAHTFCAASSTAIQAALTAASDGGANDNEDNTIEIVVGTHLTTDLGTSQYFYYQNLTTTRKLDVNGGYNGNCSTITENPALTKLDGGGVTRVFGSESSSGDVSLRYLTFQNGNVGTSQSGGGVLMNASTGDDGPIIFDQNIVRNNHSSLCAGGFDIGASGSGTIQFENNLIVDNNAQSCDGGGEIIDDGAGANVINNTFANNTVTDTPASATGGLYFYFSSAASPPPDTMSNNIFWGNSGYDLNTAAVLVRNDFGSDEKSIDPASSGNVNENPQFSGSTDFHLLPTSPLLGLGTLTPTGGLPTIDIEGHSRTSLNGKVDLGAYERGNEIFKDGFED